MSPEYYLHHLTFFEADDFLAGMNRRPRHIYEAARMLHALIGGMFADGYKLPDLPWDDEDDRDDEEYTEEEIEMLREEASLFDKLMNSHPQQ